MKNLIGSGWPGFLVLLIILKGFLFLIDHHPMFFLNDSMTYIRTAIWGWIPPDRSFVYGFFIRAIAVPTQSLLSVVAAQVFLGGISAIVLAHLSIRYFHIRPWLAFTMALLTCIEPLQLMYERYVMAETLALAFFTIYVWLILHYLENSRLRWLWIIQGTAALLISARFAFIPMAWICSLAIPIFAARNLVERTGVKGLKAAYPYALHVILSVLALFIFTTAYKHLNGHLKKLPPAYSYESGFFALCFILPIIEANDFPDPDLGYSILHNLRFDPSSRNQRGNHRWKEGGVIDRICDRFANRIEANALARNTAIRAIITKPFAFMKLSWGTFTDYFDNHQFQKEIKNTIGNRKLEAEWQQMLTKYFNYPNDRSSALELKSFSGQLFFNSAIWFQILLFIPLWIMIFMDFSNNVQRRTTLAIFLVSLCSVGVAIFLVNRPTVRFLHTSAWLFLLSGGIGVNRFLNVFEEKLKWIYPTENSKRRTEALIKIRHS
jgi:hypothetical protein